MTKFKSQQTRKEKEIEKINNKTRIENETTAMRREKNVQKNNCSNNSNSYSNNNEKKK